MANKRILFDVSKYCINNVLRRVGFKVVSASWGPRGAEDALQRVKKLGVMPRQIIDVGAATGDWAIECLRVFDNSDYFLVDPLEENIASLKELQKRHPKINIWQGALGASTTQLELYEHDYNSSFFESEYSISNRSSKRVVEVRTLDSFLKDRSINPPDMIKADVQGFEIEVLKGAQECLNTTELLLLEVSYRRIYKDAPLAHEVISYVGSKGFRLFDICSYIQRPYDGELVQSDILFAREDSSLFKYEGWKK